MLPFPEDLELPELPDVSKMLDFPKTFMEDTMAKIPLPDNMKKCFTPSEPYIDMKCMIDATGLETMIDFAQTIQGVAENMVPALTDSLSSFFNVVSCTQETNFTLPVRQSVLDTLGIDLGTSCDQQISVCTAVDFGDIDIIGEIFHEVEEEFQPVLNIMEKMLQPSHINGTPNLEAPLPLLPNPLPLFTLSGDLIKGTLTRESGLVNGGVMKDLTFLIPHTGNGSYDPGRKDTSKEDAVKDVTDFSVLGLHVRLSINLEFDFDWTSYSKKLPFQERFGMYHLYQHIRDR